MAEVPAAIPPDALQARPPFQLRRPAAEVPAAGDNPVPPVEEVSWFLLPYRGCFLPAT